MKFDFEDTAEHIAILLVIFTVLFVGWGYHRSVHHLMRQQYDEEVRVFHEKIDSLVTHSGKMYFYSEHFAEDSLVRVIKALGFDHPHIVHAQAIVESAGFTSAIFVENNNLFGMKCPTQRLSTCIGTNRSHAVYYDWISSVVDYKLWYSYMIAPNTPYYEVLEILTNVYAEDPLYGDKVHSGAVELLRLYE